MWNQKKNQKKKNAATNNNNNNNNTAAIGTNSVAGAIPIGYTIDAQSTISETSDISGPLEASTIKSNSLQLQSQYIQFPSSVGVVTAVQECDDHDGPITPAGTVGRNSRVSHLLKYLEDNNNDDNGSTQKDNARGNDDDAEEAVVVIDEGDDVVDQHQQQQQQQDTKINELMMNNHLVHSRPLTSPTSVTLGAHDNLFLLSQADNNTLPSPSSPTTKTTTPAQKKKKNTIIIKKDRVHVEILLPPKISSTLKIPTLIKFSLSSANLELREEEMRSIANDALIPTDRWNGSLIYRKWKENTTTTTTQEDEHHQPHSNSNNSNVLSIEPPLEIQSVWSEEFVTSLHQFCESGYLHVSEKGSGRDFLVLCEYFGIVHSPTKVTYESYGAFLRMKLWTDYLSRRTDMALYIINKCLSRSKLSHTFVTTTDPEEVGFSYHVDGRPCEIFDGGLVVSSLDDDNNDGTPPADAAAATTFTSCSVVYDFFNDESEQTIPTSTISSNEVVGTTSIVVQKTESFAKTLRNEFADFLEKSLPGTKVCFESAQVKLKTKVLMLSIGPRAVLTIVPFTPPSLPPPSIIVDTIPTTPTDNDNDIQDDNNNNNSTLQQQGEERMITSTDPCQHEQSSNLMSKSFSTVESSVHCGTMSYTLQQPQTLEAISVVSSKQGDPNMVYYNNDTTTTEDGDPFYSRFICIDTICNGKNDSIESCNAQWLLDCFNIFDLFSDGKTIISPLPTHEHTSSFTNNDTMKSNNNNFNDTTTLISDEYQYSNATLRSLDLTRQLSSNSNSNNVSLSRRNSSNTNATSSIRDTTARWSKTTGSTIGEKNNAEGFEMCRRKKLC